MPAPVAPRPTTLRIPLVTCALLPVATPSLISLTAYLIIFFVVRNISVGNKAYVPKGILPKNLAAGLAAP